MLKDCCLWIIIPTFAHEYTRGAIPNRLTNVFLGRLMSPLSVWIKQKQRGSAYTLPETRASYFFTGILRHLPFFG
jgi:hypothetical protein